MRNSINSWFYKLCSTAVPFLMGLLLGIVSNTYISTESIRNGYAVVRMNSNFNLPAVNHERPIHRKTLLCWIVVSPSGHDRAKFVRDTWAKKCDKYLFLSTISDSTLPTVKLSMENDTYNRLWGKTKVALKFIYDHHLQDADWFLKADIDTYVIIENLREKLSSFDPSIPLLLGRRFYHNDSHTFYSGGAGYVLTKEAIRRFVEYKPDLGCRKSDEGSAEDLFLTSCMEKVGVRLLDSRDGLGLHTFNSHNLLTALTHFSRTKGYFSPGVDFYPNNGNRHSSKPITFHYVKDFEHLLYDFLIYNVTFKAET